MIKIRVTSQLKSSINFRQASESERHNKPTGKQYNVDFGSPQHATVQHKYNELIKPSERHNEQKIKNKIFIIYLSSSNQPIILILLSMKHTTTSFSIFASSLLRKTRFFPAT
jgi:uncharacterized membrane protein